MRIKILLMVTATVFTCGCASTKKVNTADAPPAAPPTVTTSTDTKPIVPSAIEASSIVCMAGQDKRVMEIEKSSPGCKLKYSKFSDSDPVAWSFKGPDHCEKVRSQIRGTLESAGFKCDGEGAGKAVAGQAPNESTKTPSVGSSADSKKNRQ